MIASNKDRSKLKHGELADSLGPTIDEEKNPPGAAAGSLFRLTVEGAVWGLLAGAALALSMTGS